MTEKTFFKPKKIILNSILAIIVILLYFYVAKLFTYTYVTLIFDDLRPTHEKLSVYYKGIKVGKVFKIRHTKDYQHTLMSVMLFPSDLKLPSNTTATLRKIKRNGFIKTEHDIIELDYPKMPVLTYLANNSSIEGKNTVDLNSYLSSQDPDSLDEIRDNLAHITANLSSSTEELTNILVLVQDVIKENENNLSTSTKNLSLTTGNLNNITKKVDNSIKQKTLENTFTNLDASVSNIKTSTSGLNNIAQNLTGTTQGINEVMPRIDSTLYEAQGIVKNVNDITCGISKTLRKPFGGLRILFGKTIDTPKCCK